MSVYLNTLGEASLSVAICDRCKMKRPIGLLASDPNSPGIRACKDTCIDDYDPWRLPAPPPDKITVKYPRPDAPLTT